MTLSERRNVNSFKPKWFEVFLFCPAVFYCKNNKLPQKICFTVVSDQKSLGAVLNYKLKFLTDSI